MRLVLVALLMCALAAMSAVAERRGPIHVDGDEAFTEENGVVRGSGTEDDPYRISGWEISVPDGENYGIHIRGTTAHFVIEGCRITGAVVPEGAAISLEDVRGGRIANTTVQNSRHGIEILSSQGVEVANTYLFVHGIGVRVVGMTAEEYDHVIDTTNTINGEPVHYYYGLDGEVLEGIRAAHITVAGSQEVTLRDVSVEDGDGITIAHSDSTTVERADLFKNRAVGLLAFSSSDTLIRDCARIANNAEAGVYVWLSDRTQVLRTGLYANHTGLYVVASDNVVADENVYAWNQVGVWVDGGATDIEVSRGLFRGGHYGVYFETAHAPTLHASAMTDVEIGVFVGPGTAHAAVTDSSFVDMGHGISMSGSKGRLERNLIARSDIGLLFPEQYGRTTPAETVIRRNLVYRSAEGLYLGRDTEANEIYENLFWDTGRAARDNGDNIWAPLGHGNWYSDYTGDPKPTAGGGMVWYLWASVAVAVLLIAAAVIGLRALPRKTSKALFGSLGLVGMAGLATAITIGMMPPSGVGDTEPYRIGAQPVEVGGGRVDPAPLIDWAFLDAPPGLLGTLVGREIELEDAEGAVARLEARVADRAAARFIGFQGLPAEVAEAIALLFEWDEEVEVSFHMQHVFLGLDLLHFASDRTLLERQAMEPDVDERYTSTEPFRYALELPTGTLERLGLEDPVRIAW